MSTSVAPSGLRGGRRDVLAGVWRLADPKISLASFASMLLAAGATWHWSRVHPGWLALTVLGIFAVEVGKNASGEVVDWDSGTDLRIDDADRSPFSGGKRVLVDGLLTRAQTIAVSAACFAFAVLVGVAILLAREPQVLWVMLPGAFLAYFYHGGPIRLSYRGFGELAVALAYGPLLCAGTYLVQSGEADPAVALVATPLGLLISAFLVANEFPDYRADAASGKRTLVVRLGRRRASALFAGMVIVAFALLAALPLLGLPAGVLLGFVALPPAVAAVRTIRAHPEETSRIVPAQAKTLLAFVLYALGAAVGLAISAR